MVSSDEDNVTTVVVADCVILPDAFSSSAMISGLALLSARVLWGATYNMRLVGGLTVIFCVLIDVCVEV